MMTEANQDQQTASAEPNPKPRKSWKYFGFRFAAILLGLSPILIFELVARVAGWGLPNELEDPFVGFSEVRPLFVLSENRESYEISESRYPLFRPESFPAQKADNEYRIFCLGGSTVQGRPYAIETAFSTWLELCLNEADQSKQWEVVNCGGVSYASYRLIPIFDEILKYKPDLVVLYTGHNEFLEDRTYDEIKRVPDWTRFTHDRLSSIRTYNLIRTMVQGSQDLPASLKDRDKEQMPTEVDAMLDYNGGLDNYHRDEAWRKDIVKHFESNLRLMIAKAKLAGVDLILVNPVCNLKDSPPFKSQRKDGLTPEQIEKFNRISTRILLDEEATTEEKLDLCEDALAIDDQFADLYFQMGHGYLALGDAGKARESFIRAKEEDVCPLRLLEPMRKIINDVAEDTGTPMIDLQAHFDDHSKDKITGRYWLIDHVHPTIAGHQRIAEQIMLKMGEENLATLNDQWTETRGLVYRRHLEKLEPIYFETGKQRLAGLMRWTQGRSAKKKSPKPATSKD